MYFGKMNRVAVLVLIVIGSLHPLMVNAEAQDRSESRRNAENVQSELTGNQVMPSMPVTAVCSSPDGQWLVSLDRGLFLCDSSTLRETKQVESQIEKIYAIKFSPSGESVAVSGGTPGELGVVELFSYPELALLRRWECHDDVATDLVWMSEHRLVSGDMTGSCCRLNLDSDRNPELISIHSKGVLAVERVGDGEIVAAGLTNSLRIWGEGKRNRNLNNHTAPVNDLAMQAENGGNSKRVLVSASDDGTIRFWYPQNGRMVRFVRLESIPTCVVWDASGQTAIAGCRDGKVRMVDFKTARVARTIPGSQGWVNGLALSPDGKQLLIGGANGLRRVGIAK